MKKLLILVFGLFTLAPLMFSQNNEKWEELGERLAEKAERLAEMAERQAENIEYLAEKNAAQWEARAERFSEGFERKWNRNRDTEWKTDFPLSPNGVFLGIESSEISREKARKLGFENAYGSYVSRVVRNSAAEKAGLQPFDYIYGVNEQRTSDNQDISDILEDYEPGDEVTLHFIRKGEKQTVNVKLGSHEDHDWDDDNSSKHGFLGVSPHDEDDEEEMNGVAVEIVEKSTAEELGLKDGDVITSINGYPVLDWDDVTTAIENTNPGDQIEVEFHRKGEKMKGKGNIKSYQDVYPDSGENWNLDIDWDEVEGMADRVDDMVFDWGQSDDRAFLGIYTDVVSESKAKKLGFDNPYGTYVSGIIPNTAADKAGLKVFDYIYGIDEYRVGENQHLGGILKKYKPGDKATVHFIRQEKKSSAQLTFGKPSDAKKVERNSCEDPFFGIIQTQNETGEDGVAVSPVKGSAAEALGLRKGDVMVRINGNRMLDWNDVTTAINAMNPGETISVEYIRDGKKMKGAKAITSYAEAKNCEDCDCGKKENVIINMDKPMQFDFRWKDEERKESDASSTRLNVSDAKVAMENVTPGESSSLQGKGIAMPENNTLNVENLRLSPDAGMGMFNLEFKLPSSGNTVVKVFNEAGRVIYEYDLGRFDGQFNDYVDISQNGPGNYFLQISQGDKIFAKKIVLTNS